MELKHRSLVWAICFHSREVPSSKFVDVNDTVSVKIKVLESSFKITITQLISKFLRKFSELSSVNSSTPILIKLSKSWFNIFIEEFIILSGRLCIGFHDVLSICISNSDVDFIIPLFQLSVNFAVVRLCKSKEDWSRSIELVKLFRHSEIFIGHSGQVGEDTVEGASSFSFLETIESCPL